VEIDDFFKVSHIVWAWVFVDMYIIHLEIRIQRSTFHIYLRKWFFWTSKDYCPPLAWAKETLSSTLNVMILQMIRNKTIRFGKHIDIEVSYKILVGHTKISSNFALFGLLSKGAVWRQFWAKNILGPLGVNVELQMSKFWGVSVVKWTKKLLHYTETIKFLVKGYKVILKFLLSWIFFKVPPIVVTSSQI
jgi:hypothetical protein